MDYIVYLILGPETTRESTVRNAINGSSQTNLHHNKNRLKSMVHDYRLQSITLIKYLISRNPRNS